MQHGTHHLAKRVKDGASSFDRVMLVVGTAAAFMTLPQILSVWQHGAEGVSLLSWVAYTLHSALWVTYGVVHRERTIIFANAIWAVMNALVVIGILALR